MQEKWAVLWCGSGEKPTEVESMAKKLTTIEEIKELLEYLDGRGIIYTDDELVEDALIEAGWGTE